jgi:hypothetical protein
MHHIRTASGQYLQSPRTPAEVRKLGYGFTSDPAGAWPFVTEKQAAAKLRVVDRHMGGSLSLEVVR